MRGENDKTLNTNRRIDWDVQGRCGPNALKGGSV